MNLLLDTHTLIWLLEGDINLSQAAKLAIKNPENTSFIDVATLKMCPEKCSYINITFIIGLVSTKTKKPDRVGLFYGCKLIGLSS